VTTLIITSALLNLLLAIWILRLLARVARLEQDATDQRIELRLLHSKPKPSSYAKELVGMREAGL